LQRQVQADPLGAFNLDAFAIGLEPWKFRSNIVFAQRDNRGEKMAALVRDKRPLCDSLDIPDGNTDAGH
jgi:hypothetical protein